MRQSGRIDLLDHAFEHVRNGLALIDADGVVLRANAAAAAMLGRTPEELVGRSFAGFLHRDDLGAALDSLGSALGEGSSGPVDLRARRSDGTWIWLRGNGTLLPTPSPVAFVVFEDVTAEREVADRLERADAELRREQAEAVRRGYVLASMASLPATSSDDLEPLIEGITELAVEHLAPLAGVVLVDEHDGTTFEIVNVHHRDPEAEATLRAALAEAGPTPLGGQIGAAIESGEVVVASQGSLHPALSRYTAAFPGGAGMGERVVAPMNSPEGALGALVLMRHWGEPEFTPADRDLIAVVAARAALALRNVRLDIRRQAAELATARRAAQQAAVAQLGRGALAGASVSELAEQATKLVVSTLDVPYCTVLFDDDHPDGMLLAASAGLFAEHVGSYRRRHDVTLRDALGRHEPTLVRDLAAEATTTARRALVAHGVRSLAATAILPRQAHAGLLVAGGLRVDAFGRDDTTFLETMANVLASALDARQAVEDLRHNALHDGLTGLPNRALVLDRLELALGQSTRSGAQVAVLVCDLDRFKVVNDALGHAAGDEVLALVGERLRGIVRPGDTVGRFGGDEFVVVCPEVADAPSVVEIAERLASGLRDPMVVHGTTLVVTASVGIALGQGAVPAAGLLRDADAAMYRAKSRGRARYELFDDDMRAWAGHRLRVESELRRAVTEAELVLHYQPVLSATSAAVVGVEALVRWAHPTRGLVLPGDFLVIAAECGLLPDVGAWAFEEAARQTVAWSDAATGPSRWTAVNLAAQQLGDPRLVERIDAILASTGVDPALMRIELTEDALVEDTVQVASVLDALRDRQLRISVDDFGTGYSSLAYLKRLPLDMLKLDRCFVAGLGQEGGDDEVIARAVVGLAQALGLQVVGEGVETEAQLAALRAMGCDLVQGFLLARPMPAAELDAWLVRHGG